VRSHPRLNSLDLLPFQGLTPQSWIITENGVSREDVKEFLLNADIPFVSDAVLDLTSFTQRVLKGLVEKERILGATTRQELLRGILRKTFREKDWSELRKLRHQKGFYKKLDQSIQSLRLTYGNEDERLAQLERLAEFPSQLRHEVGELVVLYEEWLAAEKLWDLPRLLLASTAVLQNPEIPVTLPMKVLLLSPKKAESRLEFLFDELSRRVEVERLFLVEENAELLSESLEEKCDWQEWHTLDDAADFLVSELSAAVERGELADHGVLIPDQPEVRRSLMRALKKSGISLRDPRDPTQIRFDEEIKKAMLPLRSTVTQFSQKTLVELLSLFGTDGTAESSSEILEAIYEEALRDGLSEKLVSRFPVFGEKLRELEKRLSGRQNAEGWRELHLAFLGEIHTSAWVVSFFEKTWSQYLFDLKLMGEKEKKRPLKYFFERLESRVWESTPPIEKRQYPEGLELFRLGTTPVRLPKRLWAFGLPARWTSLEEIGDYALSARDREILAGSFLIRSSHDEGKFRKNALRLWIAEADQVTFLDATYAFDGRERETVGPLLKELGFSLAAEKKGAVSRFIGSFLSKVEYPSRKISLPVDPRTELRASDLEAFSRCGFQALLRSRWKLSELRESDLEIRADAKGIILHEAAKFLLLSRVREGSEEGEFALSPKGALEKALEKTSFKGLFQSKRLDRLTKKELLKAIEDFSEKEKAWWKIARTDVYALEGPELRWEKDGVIIKGRPDRVDSHPDGLWLIDYKSGSQHPAGSETLEKSYRLQLPIYSLALRAQTGEEVLGYQFVEIRKKSKRSVGLTSSHYFGKDPGSLLQSIRKTSRSVVGDGSIEEIWKQFDEQVTRDLSEYRGGQFSVQPRIEKECDRCFGRDACGQRRFPKNEESSEEGEESSG
jgi:RecB family exonuclease